MHALCMSYGFVMILVQENYNALQLWYVTLRYLLLMLEIMNSWKAHQSLLLTTIVVNKLSFVITGDIKRAQFESNVTFNTGCINATLNIDITDDACCKENDNFRLKIDDQHLTDSYYELIDVSTTDNFFTEVIIWDDDCNGKRVY